MRQWTVTGVSAGLVVLALSAPASAQGVNLPLGADAPASPVAKLEDALSSGWLLGRGAHGDAVKELQERLKDLGYGVTVDGDFGGGTDRALKSFQRSNGLRADGLLGSDTLKALSSAVASIAAPAPVVTTTAPEAPAEVGGPATTTTNTDVSTVGVAGVLRGDEDAGDSRTSTTTTPAAPTSAQQEDLAAARSGGILKKGAKGAAVSALQSLLKSLGFPVSVDGDFGSGTRDALKRFQSANGLTADGVAGPKTFDAIESAASGGSPSSGSDAGTGGAVGPNGEPKWMATARGELGVREVSGSGNNPRIVDYHVAGGAGRSPDSVAWCSSFVNWVMKQNGIRGTGRANARSWLDWGQRLSKPKKGAVVVFWRESPSSWKGHVGFYAGETATDVYVLGGNQSNSVSVQKYPKSRVLGYRWPSGQ